MASDWSTPSDFAASDRKAWHMKINSTDSAVDAKHSTVAPEELMLAPEDFEIIPEDVQSDTEEWAIVTIESNGTGKWRAVTGEND